MYHYFYKITNNINGKFYYGIHNTSNLNDNYMGSDIAIKKAEEKYGIDNFSKDILQYFDTSDDAFRYEHDFITESVIQDPSCYNMKIGGSGWQNQYIKKNKIVVFDGEKNIQIDKEIYQKNKDKYTPLNVGTVLVKDKENNIFRVSVTDERYLSGELISANKGYKLTEEHKKKLSIALKEYAKHTNIKKDIKKKCWVYKLENNEVINKLIYLDVLSNYINDGWIKGRKTGTLCLPKNRHTSNNHTSCNKGKDNPMYGKVYVTKYNNDNTFTSIRIDKIQLNDYISNGWVKGRKMNKTQNYPSKDKLYEKYNELQSWKKVGDFFNLSKSSLYNLRNQYDKFNEIIQ